MRRTARTLAVAVTLAALSLTSACGGTDQEQAATSSAPAPAAPTSDDAEPSTAPTTDEAEESSATTSEETSEESTETSEETSDDATGSAGEDAGGTGSASVIPAAFVEEEPSWSAEGRFVGVFGEVLVMETESSAEGVRLVGYGPDGEQAWEARAGVPAAIEAGTQDEPLVLRGTDSIIVGWSGASHKGGLPGAIAVSIIEPKTGKQRASGQMEVDEGVRLQDGVSHSEFLVSNPSVEGYALVVGVENDGRLGLYDGRHMDYHGALPVDREVGVVVNDEERTLTVIGADGEAIGETRQCAWPDGPGWTFVTELSPDGTWGVVPGAVVNLEDGTVSCLSETPDMVIYGQAVADDGSVIGAVEADGKPMGMVLQSGDGVRLDEKADAAARGFLGDLVIFETEGGVAAHALT